VFCSTCYTDSMFAGNTDYFYSSQGYCCVNSAFCLSYIIQGDLRGNVNILAGVRINHCEKVSSYEYVYNFKRLPSWGYLDLKT
jgi:hypothetical protein